MVLRNFLTFFNVMKRFAKIIKCNVILLLLLLLNVLFNIVICMQTVTDNAIILLKFQGQIKIYLSTYTQQLFILIYLTQPFRVSFYHLY